MIIQLKYGYEGYRQFLITLRPGLFPEAQPLEINMGKGEWLLPVSQNNHTLTVLLYRYNTFMSVHLHLLSFL